MTKLMAVAMVLACSTAWGQADPALAGATGITGAVGSTLQNMAQTTAVTNRTMAATQWDAASAIIGQWNPNVGDYQAMADIVLEAQNPDPMQAMMVWMLLDSIQRDVAEMWGLTGEALVLREQAHVEYLVGDSYFFDGLWSSSDVWFMRSMGNSSTASMKMMRSMEVRMRVLEQIAILLDLVGP